MSSSGDTDKPFLSNVDDNNDVEDLDLESLSAKACALASVPVPDYASSIEHANKRSKKKYGNRFTIDDDDHDDGEELLDDKDKDTSIVLAERTSQILSNFQDYVSGIGGSGSEGPSAAEEILSPNKDKAAGGNEESVTFISDVASSIRADNKTKLLSDDNNKALSGRRQSDYSTGSGPLAREWNYDAKSNNNSQNLHDAAANIEDWEDPEAFLARGQPYTHPLMPSRRVKIGVLNCLVVSAIVALGVGLGVTTRANTKEGEELGEKVDELEEELAQQVADVNNGGSSGGSSGGGGAQSMNTEMGPPEESSASKIIDAFKPPKLTKEQQYMYQNMMAMYQPKEFSRSKGWTGKTYLDAFEFCANVKPDEDDPIDKSFTYDICPYEAICPLGADFQPSGGYKDAVEGYTWIPIRDVANDWAQLSRDNACVKYSSENEYPPEWGMEGNEDEKITSHVMCCLSSESLDGISDDSMLYQIKNENAPQHGEDDPNYDIYQAVGMEFLPLEFDRSKGWTGETYLEALQFCGAMDRYEICPYEALCPLGPDENPLGGVKDDRAGSWVPILDSANDWVQVGRQGKCLKYSGEHGTPPQWSITGGNEEMTRHVMCCLLRKKAWMSEDDHAAYELQKQQEKEQHLPKTEMDEETEAKYKLAAETYMPIEYDRTKEWDGRTYAQADYFCSGIEVEGRDYRICPFAAICAAGPGSEPLGGYKMNVEQAWMPISDERNDWVSVTEVNACIKWSGLNPTAPEWGITGQNAEEMTRHILCCAVDDDAVAEEVTELGVAMVQHEEAFEKEQAEEEMEAVQEEEGAVEAAEQAYAQEMAYKGVAEAYAPISFTREKGWLGRTYLEAVEFCESQVVDGKRYSLCPFEAICPIPSGKPLGGWKSAGQAWVPISDQINDWVQVSELSPSCMKWSDLNVALPIWGMEGNGSEDRTKLLTCCSGVPMSDAIESMEYSTEMMYKEADEKYEPLLYDRAKGWDGQTYLAAFEFCGAQGGKTLCPFNAICPMGLDGAPTGGFQDEPNGSWVPVLADEEDPEGNQWVQIARDNACTLYTGSHPTKPDWGLTGEGNEDITRHLLCCKDEGETSGGDSLSDEVDKEVMAVVQNLMDNFQPISFDRNNGWSGQTYLEAIDFCASVENKGGENETYEICPYEALCPFGYSEPLTGAIEDIEGGAAWVPISTSSNDWVNISPNNPCVKYSSSFSNKPEWGQTGENNEELTRNIICCKGSIYGKPEESYLYQIAAQKYHPIWYERGSGWDGTKYTDGIEFCKNRGATLCPYEALCPMSDLDAPLGGIINEKNVWVPISDVDNAWVSAGPENTCKLYDAVYGETAEWGLTGEGSEPATRHIMCCKVDFDGETAVTETVETPATTAGKIPTSKPTLKPTNPRITNKPTSLPTPLPTSVPTPLPTPPPTSFPTLPPTPLPTNTPTPPPTPLPSNPPTPRPSGKPTIPPISGAMGTAVESDKSAEKYNPVWYDRSSGWNGQTYDEAFEFCSSKGPNHDMCPYSVICPNGPLANPYGGSRTERMSWAPMNEPFNSWVQVANLQVCVEYKNLNPDDSPSWGLTGVNNEDITRHILCCDMNGADSGNTSTQHKEEAIALAYDYVVNTYAPKWYDRSEGWQGKTYTDAIAFCASKDSYIPCPYDAYCPMGPGSFPTGGYFSEEAWAAIMDAPNAWVQIGSHDRDDMSDSCMKYNNMHDTPPLWGLLGNSADDVTPNIMCCKEPADHFMDGMDTTTLTAVATTKNEQEILEKMHPVWFGRKHGYHGKTWQEASDFCAAVGDMTLCPPSAYCPSDTDEKLFLGKDPFKGTQWAPAASEISSGVETWVSIGQSPTPCSTHDMSSTELQDGIPQELKENILCCSNPKYLSKEHELKKELEPIWMDNTHGWNGGNHEEANEFCGGFGNRQVCPYTAYCPHGPGHPVMGGHKTDFNALGEQWAPIFGQANKWVMIGQKYQNRATTCLDSLELEGSGVFEVDASMKKYIMCCTF